jgi:hypothetical protein
MKKLLAIVFASSLFLAGCNSVTTTSPVTPTTTTPTWTDVQSAVVAACGFLPTVTTIASIVTANPAVSTGSQIAQLICKAVVPAKVSKKLKLEREIQTKVIVINNKVVEINGKFVK